MTRKEHEDNLAAEYMTGDDPILHPDVGVDGSIAILLSIMAICFGAGIAASLLWTYLF